MGSPNAFAKTQQVDKLMFFLARVEMQLARFKLQQNIALHEYTFNLCY